MRVADVNVTDTARGARLSAVVVSGKGRPEIEFVYRGLPASAVSTPGDAMLGTVLLPAMAAREDVIIDAPVSAQLLRNAEEIIDIWASWRPRWHRPSVTAPRVDRAELAPTAVASCFSGGVDSFFTALRPRDEPISVLLTMIGFTVFDELRPRMDEATPALARAAHALGKQHVAVDSNAFAFGLRYLPGSEHHGAVLAAMALGLGSFVRRCYIASSWALGRLRPWGSHPDVDPLWSTEALEIVHDGAEFRRIEKVRSIASSEVALDTLRVCTRRRDYPENCRTCDKCQRTALLLYLAGALERSRTLGPVTPQTVRRMVIRPGMGFGFEDLVEQIDDPELKRALRAALRNSRLRGYARPLGRVLRRIGLRN